MTCGPYRPLVLRTYTTRIADLYPQTTVSSQVSTGEKSTTCTLAVRLGLSGLVDAIETTRVVLSRAKAGGTIEVNAANKSVVVREVVVNGERLSSVVPLDGSRSEDDSDESREIVKWYFDPDEIELWWPVGYGEQALYEVRVELYDRVSSFSYSCTRL